MYFPSLLKRDDAMSQKTLILATEGAFLDALIEIFGVAKNGLPVSWDAGFPEVHVKESNRNSWVLVSRGHYGLLPAAIQSTVFCANPYLSSSLIVHVGTAGYTGSDIAVGEIAFSTFCKQWDLDLTALGFAQGEMPGGKKASAIPADLGRSIPEGCKSAPLLSGSSFVDMKNLPTALSSFTENGHVLVDMEGAGVCEAASTFGVDAICVRLVTSNKKGTGDFNRLITSSADRVAQAVSALLTNLGRC